MIFIIFANRLAKVERPIAIYFFFIQESQSYGLSLAAENLLEIYNCFWISVNDYLWDSEVAKNVKFILGSIFNLKDDRIFYFFAWSVLFGCESDCHRGFLRSSEFDFIRSYFEICIFKWSDIEGHLNREFSHIFEFQYFFLSATHYHVAKIANPGS